MGGRVIHALGYTGLGVGSSRWAAGVVRDFILDPDSDLLRLDIVRSAPFPFPPEPLRSVAVNLVRRELARADRDEGRRGLLSGRSTRWASASTAERGPGGLCFSRGATDDAEAPMTDAPIFLAIRGGDEAAVDRILAANPAAGMASDGAGLSALTVAAYHRQWPIVDRILATGPDLDPFEAAIVGDAERLRTLLDEAEGERRVEREAAGRRPGGGRLLDGARRSTPQTTPPPPRSTDARRTGSAPSTSRPSSADSRSPGCSSTAAPIRIDGPRATRSSSRSTAPSPAATRTSRRSSSSAAPT